MVNSGEREPTTRNVDHKRAEKKKTWKEITWSQEIHSAEWWPTYWKVNDQSNDVTKLRSWTKEKKKTTRFPKGGPGVLSQGSQLAPEKPRLACQSLTKGPWKASKAKIKDGQRAWSWIRWSSQERHQTICSQLRWAAMPLSVDGEYGG